jgi:membrane protease YdiL (CAAX protease family)
MAELIDDLSANVKNRSPWAQLGLFLRVVGFALVAIVAIGAAAGSLLPKPLSNTTLKLLQMITTIVLFGGTAFFYARLSYPVNPMVHLGLRPAIRSNFYLLSILLLLFAFPLEAWLGIVNRQIPLPHWMIESGESIEKQTMAMLTAKNSFDILLNLIVVAVMPGIFEEMCFRGALQPILVRLVKNPWLGIFITSCIFSFMHFEFQGFIPRVLLGMLLGISYWYSGSLWAPIIGHCFFNGIQVLAISYYPDTMDNKSPSLPIYTIILSAILVGALLMVMRRQYLETRSDPNSNEWH